MKNPFRFLKRSHHTDEETQTAAEEETVTEEEEIEEPVSEKTENPDDGFVEWLRSAQRGGIERRERNDIYETYSVYGADEQGRLICRLYHRYPEHERDFGLSYSRVLQFDEFNKRLLAELDRGDIKLGDYHACIEKAEQLCGITPGEDGTYTGFSRAEAEILRDFCEAADTLTDKEYRTGDGIFRCSCRSVVGDESLNLWFRRPLRHDALDTQVSGVSRVDIGGYDIESMWIMGVYNRISERCERCRVTKLVYDWSAEKETVFLMTLEGFGGIGGTLLLAVSDAAAFSRFGFYSLDFSHTKP